MTRALLAQQAAKTSGSVIRVKFAPHPVSLRQLQYLVAVADHASFRKAAEECRVAQPSLSAQVALAESALGLQLFERDRRRVVTTRAGESFLRQARDFLRQADELMELSQRINNPFAGVLRIGVIPTVGPYFVPEVAPKLQAAFPKLNLRWVEEKTPVLREQLANAEIDCAILVLDLITERQPHRVIGNDEFVLAAAPGNPLLSSKRPLVMSELDGAELLLLDDGHCFREQALSVCASGGASELSYRATSLSTLVQMTASGRGVTLLPSLCAGVENRHGLLKLRRFAPPAPARTLVLAWRKSSAVENVLLAVGDTLAQCYGAALVNGAF